MNKKRLLILTTFIIVSTLLIIPFSSANIFDWIKNRITGMASQQTTSLNLTVGNNVPTILVIYIPPSVDPVDNTDVEVNLSFLADDEDGINQLINASANATFTLDATGVGNGVQLNDTLCDPEPTGNNATVQNYTCAITMRYWDRATDWSVNVTVSDTASQAATFNTTFTYTSLTAINMTPTAMTWGAVTLASTDSLASNNPISVGNTGNYNVTVGNINISAINLGGEYTTDQFITADNFTINNASACNGLVLQNNTDGGTDTSITGEGLPSGLNIGERAADELLYICLEEVPQAISQQSYSTVNVGSWSIGVV